MASKQRAAVIAHAVGPQDPKGGHRIAADYGL